MKQVNIVRRNTRLVATLLMSGLVEWTFAQAKDGASTALPAGKVALGDARVTGAHLKPFTNLWKMTQQKPDGPVERLDMERRARDRHFPRPVGNEENADCKIR